jgi:hypothetical protein
MSLPQPRSADVGAETPERPPARLHEGKIASSGRNAAPNACRRSIAAQPG